jgi:2-oxoglutarate dehydrogenase E1 component
METFQLSQTRAYRTGGTIHIVINNQVGFTTSRQDDARSTEYCTDIAKMVGAPILHVNGDNPDAVMFAAMLATDYRYEFGKDVVIDLVCYRRRGHNETDEPSSTQPLMYDIIKKHSTTRSLYAQKLINEGVIQENQANDMANVYRSSLDKGEFVVHNLVREPDTTLFVDWIPYLDHDWRIDGTTGIELSQLKEVAAKITTIPDGIVVQRQVAKIYDDRRKMAGGALPLNWGMAELLAYGSLLKEGYPIRFTGQDVRRGTFSHRHAVIFNQRDGEAYLPLVNMYEDQPRFDIYDSVLSEEAVLAFEYGYATTAPKGLIIWEAQFGDFANGAQVVIDQFIASGEHKWGRLCGLTMMLPHGFEGQGPEHSSARLERFLQLCAEHNMQICNPTTPAQIFHLLRRQAIRPMRRPLVIMSPKWILRHKLATSSLEDLSAGEFNNVIDDATVDPALVKRVILCSGKVYYHLLEERDSRGITDIAIIRLEQLYPFPDTELDAILGNYNHLQSAVWCQEEPMNQGAWYSSQHHMRSAFNRIDPKLYLAYAGRPGSAAPASGYMSVHLDEQKKFIDEALTFNN